jgi:6-phosphogluconolactonase
LLLNQVNIPAANIYPVPVDLPPAEAANEYESTIKKVFDEEPICFDLMLLGLGENGHTASLFPGTDVVFENTRLVKEVYVEEQKMFRITMTAKLINQSYNIMFLLEGDGKAEVLKTILTTPYQPDKYPAQIIKPVNGNLYWFVDKKAAALLPG